MAIDLERVAASVNVRLRVLHAYGLDDQAARLLARAATLDVIEQLRAECPPLRGEGPGVVRRFLDSQKSSLEQP